jgi:pSer/pThr/pTyr-binding forkhead associated (FHA) protein
MKGELRVAYGDRKGTLFALNSSVINIGRNATADVSIHWDPFVAHKHCRIDFTDEGVTATDLGSANGTLINDLRIAGTQPIKSGDLIQVGFTILQFTKIPSLSPHLADTSSDESLDEDHDQPSPTPEVTKVATTEITQPAALIDYHKIYYFDCDNAELSRHDTILQKPLFDNIIRWHGPLQDEPSSSRLLTVFAHAKPEPQFIIDFSRLDGIKPPPSDPTYSLLFDWLPTSTAFQLPCLYTMSELPNWKMILEEHWGKDAFVALISKHPKAKTIELLRRRLRYENDPASDHSEKQENQAAYGYCWPSILTRLIEMNVEGFGKKFMADFELIFSEDQTDPTNWSLIGPRTVMDSHRKRNAVFG